MNRAAMINKNNSQTLTPVQISQAGYADDNRFYIEGVAADPNSGEPLHVFIRLNDEKEIAQYYKELNNLSDQQAAVDATMFLRKNGANRDLPAQITAKIEEAKEYGQFKKIDNKAIFEEQLGGMFAMARGLNVIGKSHTANSNDGALVGSTASSKENTVYLMTANTISLSGLIKDHDYFKEMQSPVAGEHAEIEKTSVRFLLTPPTKTRQPTAVAFSVTDAQNINFEQIATNPTKMNSMIEKNSRPFQDRIDSVPRSGFMDMNVSYGDGKFHRFSYYSNGFDGGDYFNLEGDELTDVAVNWKSEHKNNLDRFRAIQDRSSLAENPSRSVLAKNDFMRIVLLASHAPNKFHDFLGKVKYNNKEAFQGITHTDYFAEKNLSPQQQAVLEITQAIANNPEKTFINTVTHNKLNISSKLEETMTNSMAASYNQASKDPSSASVYGKSSASQYIEGQPSLNVVRKTNHGVVTVIIPAMVVSDVIPQGQKEVGIIQQIHPTNAFLPNPQGSVSKGGKYTYDKGTTSCFDSTFVPPRMITLNSGTPDFGNFNSLRLLSGQMPEPNSIQSNQLQSDKQSKFLNAFTKVNDNTIDGLRVGVVDLNATKAFDRSNVIKIESPEQSKYLLHKVGFKKNFDDLMQARASNPTAAINRFDEMASVVGQMVGGFSKDNTSYNVFKKVLTAPQNELSVTHAKIRDMLLSDKLVEVELPDRQTGELVKQGFNFSDVSAVALNPSQPLRKAITEDIAGKQVALDHDKISRFKQERIDDIQKQLEAVLAQKDETPEDIASRMLDKVSAPEPTSNQRLRV